MPGQHPGREGGLASSEPGVLTHRQAGGRERSWKPSGLNWEQERPLWSADLKEPHTWVYKYKLQGKEGNTGTYFSQGRAEL